MRMREVWATERQVLTTVRRFNAANGKAWFWPKIAAALTSKHHWLIIVCDSCDTLVDLDLRVKPRDPEASIVWRCVAFSARAATATADRASSHCRRSRTQT